MMVTVKERTTEIGIRRAIGARPKDILNQILSESMVLTTFAGLMGISFGVLILQGLEIGTAASGTEAHFQINRLLSFFSGQIALSSKILLLFQEFPSFY